MTKRGRKSRKTKKPNDLLRRAREDRGWSQSRLAAQIQVDASMISRWERGERGTDYVYQEKLCILFEKSAEELGFIEQEEVPQQVKPITTLSQDISDLLINTNVSPQHLNYNNPAPIIVMDSSGYVKNILSPLQQLDTDGADMDRRDFFRESINAARKTAGFALFTPTLDGADELLNRFLTAMERPSAIDTSTLIYLEGRTASYWKDRHSAVLASNALLEYIIEHFNRATSLLESPLPPSMRVRLCSDASEIAQLAGHLLFDMGDCIRARNYHKAAIIAAQEANNSPLQATAWARMSFTWTYSGNPKEAHRCIQKARQLTEGVNTTVRAYLAAVEAEILAVLGEESACMKALEDAEKFKEHEHSSEESYWLRFDYSRLAGYKGACFRRLYYATNAQDSSLLRASQSALQDALDQLSPTKIQRRPVLLLDLASVYAKQGAIEEACNHATQALSISTQLKSKTVLQRFLSLQSELKQWSDTSYVRDLGNRMSIDLGLRGEL